MDILYFEIYYKKEPKNILFILNTPNKRTNNVALFLNKKNPSTPIFVCKFEILHCPEVRVVEGVTQRVDM